VWNSIILCTFFFLYTPTVTLAQSCNSSYTCQNPTPICVLATCVPCNSSLECAENTAYFPICDSQGCIPCFNDSAEFDFDETKPICGVTCEACVTDNDCLLKSNTTPYCNQSSGACSSTAPPTPPTNVPVLVPAPAPPTYTLTATLTQCTIQTLVTSAMAAYLVIPESTIVVLNYTCKIAVLPIESMLIYINNPNQLALTQLLNDLINNGTFVSRAVVSSVINIGIPIITLAPTSIPTLPPTIPPTSPPTLAPTKAIPTQAVTKSRRYIPAAIVIGVIAGLVVVFIIIFGIFFCLRGEWKWKKQRQAATQFNQTGTIGMLNFGDLEAPVSKDEGSTAEEKKKAATNR